MRKGMVFAAGLVSVVVLAGYAGSHWLQSRVTAEFSRTVESVRSSGARIEHSAPRVSLWSRSMTVDSIELSLPGHIAKTVRIGRLVAHGIRPATADLDSSRLELSDIEVNHALDDLNRSSVRMKIPSATAEGILVPGALATSGSAAGPSMAMFIERFRANQIKIPQLEARLTSPVFALPPQRGARSTSSPSLEAIDYTYNDVAVERIIDGRIGAMTFGATTFSGAAGSGRMDRIEAKDIDLLPLFRAGLDRRKPAGAYYGIYGKVSSGRMSVKMPDGGEFSIGSLLGSGFGIDPDKLSLASMTDMMKLLPPSGRAPSPPQTAQMMSVVTNIYQGMKFDEFTMRDVRVKSPLMPQSEMGIGALVLLDLVEGKVKQVRIDGLDVPMPRPGTGRIKMGSFALNGFDIVRLLKLAADVDATSRRSPKPSEALTLLGGIEMRDTQIPDFGGGSYTVDAFTTSWGRFINGVPADFEFSLRGRLPVSQRDPSLAILRERGMTQIAGDIEFSSRYREGSSEWSNELTRLQLSGLGSFTSKLVLGNLSPRGYERLATSFDAVVNELAVKDVELKIADLGMISILSTVLAKTMPPGSPPPTAALKAALLDPSKPGGNLGAMLDSLDRFLASPSQTLYLKLSPSEPVTFEAFRNPMLFVLPGPLAEVLERFALDVRVSK